MQYSDLDNQIFSLDTIVEEAIEGEENWSSVWNLIREIGSNFKSVRYPTKDEKNAAWSKFQDLVSYVKQQQEQAREKAKEEVQELEEELQELEELKDSAISGENSWKEVWEKIKTMNHSFKQTNFPNKAERIRLWDKFQNLIEEIKDCQERDRKDKNEFADKSENYKDEIIAAAEEARPTSEIENLIGDLILSPIRNVVNAVTLGLLDDEQDDERKIELLACSENLKEAWRLFNEYKQEMLGRDKQIVFETLREIQDELDESWESWKEEQQEIYEARQSAWRERVESRIANLEDRLYKLREVLEKRESHLAELEEKRDSAWSDNFKEKVEEWIKEEEENIEEIEEKIENIEEWLEEERQKLND